MVTFFLNHWGGDLEQAKEDMKTLREYRTECQFGSAHWQEFDSFLNFERIIGGEQYDSCRRMIWQMTVAWLNC